MINNKNSPCSCCIGTFLCLKSFCKETSIHGFNHIAVEKRHACERILWLLITFLAVSGAGYISYGQYQRYNDNPTVVILEKDFRNWNFTFPAITVCYKDNADKTKSKIAIKRIWGIEEGDEKWEYYNDFVNVVALSSIVELEGFKKFVNDESLANVNLFSLAVEVVPPLDVKTTWYDSSIVTPPQTVMTEIGVCYVINSLASIDILVNKSASASLLTTPVTCQYKAHICYFRLELQKVCIKLLFHSAYDTNELPGTGEAGILCKGHQRTVELSGLDTKAASAVKDLSVRRRGCLFLNEPINPRQKVYSNNMCRRVCRSRLAIKLCGCKPYFNEFDEGKTCDITGLVCLSKYSEALKTFHNKTSEQLIPCNCPQQCEDSVFIESLSEEKIWTKSLFANQASVKYSVQAPKTRYKRVIVFYFHDLVVSLGGAAGLFLGASFLSFVEIIYFLFAAIVKAILPSKKPAFETINAPTKVINYREEDIILRNWKGSESMTNDMGYVYHNEINY